MLGVSPLFLHLVLSETFLNGGVPVGRCVGIEHPDVQKGPLESSVPVGKTLGKLHCSIACCTGQILRGQVAPFLLSSF